MIDILGWGEWVIIGVLVLVLIGPKDLPRVLYKLGQWFQRFKETTAGVRQEFDGLIRLEHLKTLQGEEDSSLSSQNSITPSPKPIGRTRRKSSSGSKTPRKKGVQKKGSV